MCVYKKLGRRGGAVGNRALLVAEIRRFVAVARRAKIAPAPHKNGESFHVRVNFEVPCVAPWKDLLSTVYQNRSFFTDTTESREDATVSGVGLRCGDCFCGRIWRDNDDDDDDDDDG